MHTPATVPLLLLLPLLAPVASAGLFCTSQSQPNPIAKEYPKAVTGTINGTTAIVPVPFDVARSIIPAEYGILRDAYEALMPDFPKDMFPAELNAILDHGVQGSGISIPDFQRIALRFPFVDRLNDGYSSFKYVAPQMVSVSNPIALLGSMFYGKTVPASFEPPCDAYEGYGNGTTFFDAYLPGGKSVWSTPKWETRFTTVESIPYDRKVFVNITNQPAFGSGINVCDNYITLWNSSVTQGEYAPVPVKGTVKIVPPYYPTPTTLDAWGYRMDNSFIENNNVKCEDLQGYAGTGPGDSE